MSELSKRFDFKNTDDKWIKLWMDKNYFHGQANKNKKPYTVVIPPPNVTGILHMGHALNNTLQDIIVRYKRMKGFETCWMPGTDHAGIATQNVVEKKLAKEGKTRHDVGREALIEQLWDWKKKYGGTIIHQLEKLASSCDWPRTRFTMDDGYCEAVNEVFVKLYQKGLIYRGQYIINWCPRCHTALSDEEAEHKDVQGTLTHIRYALKDNPDQYLVVATTRPETMLGDTAVAVNPNDERYKNFIGKTLILPLVNREILVIADDFVDPDFGTGAVKVTPAHDPNDFAMGQRHDLKFINIMTDDGKINEKGGTFEGLDRFDARVKVIEALKAQKYFDKQEQHNHAVGHCYRCDTIIEPYLSKQWFVKMKPLAEPAIEAVKSGKIKFYPERWSKVYLNWMENIRDWCISRQIWWGHRIPVWYCVGDDYCLIKCREPIVATTPPEKCPHCDSTNLKQDEDVLDTWFSAWLWPFATFGWPKDNEDLKFFYPGHALFTASEIIFFWVARMIMAGIEFMGDIPFSDVFIHGTVRDEHGRKMSKSLGNALDPLEIIDEYGADALRFSLIINSGQDLFIAKEKFEIGRNFANKIWNAARLILMNCDAKRVKEPLPAACELDLPSNWIISKFHSTLDKVSQAIENYRYSEAESRIYDFFWGHFCDWYLEMIKDRFSDANIQTVALHILEQSLKIMHPFIPIVTEEIYSHLCPGEEALCVEPWPVFDQNHVDQTIDANAQTLIDVITTIRNTRAQWNIKPNEKIQCHLASKEKTDLDLLKTNAGLIKSLARVNSLTVEEELSETNNIAASVVQNIKCAVPLGDIIDIEQEKTKILRQIDEQINACENLSKRLNNQSFLDKAPKDVIEKEQQRLTAIESKTDELKKVMATLA